MARGASSLYLVGRNSRRDIVDQVAINAEAFARAEPQITASFETVNRMIADPAGQCTKVDNLRDNDIIVT